VEQIERKRSWGDRLQHFLTLSQHAHQVIRSLYGEDMIKDIIEQVKPTQSSKVWLQSSSYGFYRLAAARVIWCHPHRIQTATTLGPIPLCDSDDPFARIIHSEGAYYAISASHPHGLTFLGQKKGKNLTISLATLGPPRILKQSISSLA
jgi:hypothetical protein